MQQRLEEFYQTSTIHGFVYISKKRQLIERLFWIVALLLSLWGCSSFIKKLSLKIQSYPIVLYLSEEPTYVSEIDFPAFTICPEILTVIDDFNYSNVINSLQNGSLSVGELSEIELKLMQAISMVVHDEYVMDMKLKIDTSDIYEYLGKIFRKLSPPNLLAPQNAKGNWIRKNNLFLSKVITSRGYCYTFNNPDFDELFKINEISKNFRYDRNDSIPEYWNRESTKWNVLDYPVKTINYHYGAHYQEILRRNENYRAIPNDPTHENYIYEGNFLIIHDSYEYPSETLYTTIAARNKSTIYNIEPSMSILEDDLASYSIYERECYFEDEKSSQFFKVYRKSNCELEAMSSKVLEVCGCVAFYMLHNDSVDVCGLDKFHCAEQAKENFYVHRDGLECFNPCNKVAYEVNSVLDESMIIDQNGYDSNTKKELGLVYHPIDFELFFARNYFFPVIRRKQFSNADVLGLVGGFLGLFAGVSILSVVEVLFYVIKEEEEVNDREDINYQNFMKKFARGFFEESTVHGLGYMISSQKFVRNFWVISFTISMLVCGYMVHDIYAKIIHNPIIVIRDDQPHDIGELDFPAITILPDVYSVALPKYSEIWGEHMGDDDYYDNLDELVVRDNNSILLTAENFICETSFDHHLFNVEEPIDKIVEAIKNLSQRHWLEEQSGSWLGRYNLKFAEVWLKNGIGFTFNTKSFDEMFKIEEVDPILNFTYDIFMSNADKNENNSKGFPWSSKSNEEGMSLTLKKHVSGDEHCIRGGIIVHSPRDLATISVQSEVNGFVFGNLMEILIDVNVIYCDDDIRSIDFSRRKCFFEDERPLRFFKYYSYQNCLLECWHNLTYEENHCVVPFLIRDKFTKICGTLNVTSARHSEDTVRQNLDNMIEKVCNCYPDCNQIEYKVEVLYRKLDADDLGNETVSISIKFKEKEFLPFRKLLQFKLIDFLSTVGGLLGLFAGISALSVIEIFYFFTLRLITDIWRLMRQKTSTKVRPFVN